MGREIITERDLDPAQYRGATSGTLASGEEGEEQQKDTYGDRLIKYIPAEVVAVYLAIEGVLQTADDQIPVNTVLWLVFAFLLVMTPLYLRFALNVQKVLQIIISVTSFAIWVFTLGGPFLQFSWYHPIYGAIILPLFTFTIAIFKVQYIQKET